MTIAGLMLSVSPIASVQAGSCLSMFTCIDPLSCTWAGDALRSTLNPVPSVGFASGARVSVYPCVSSSSMVSEVGAAVGPSETWASVVSVAPAGPVAAM